MKFTKMQGLGNDYVYIDCFSEQVEEPEKLAVRIADRHFGVGGDGLILICPSDLAPVRMRMYNADGSEGKMCGNGARCVARYAYDHGLVKTRSFDLETGAGIRHAEVGETEVAIDMGEARLDGELEETITVNGRKTNMTPVNVGNPHAVYLVDSLETLRTLDLNAIGPAYEHHPRFLEGVNSEFLYIESPTELHMRVYERGSGETLACGTGATAVAFAAMQLGRAEKAVTVHLLGGNLKLEQRSNGHFLMTGPAVEVFSGSYFSE